MVAEAIVFVTTCRGRLGHIRETLPQNLKDNPRGKFVLLDYNDPDPLGEYIREVHHEDLISGRLIYFRNPAPRRFFMGHAKNMAQRLGILEGGEITVTLDADNFTGPGFDEFIEEKFAQEDNIFLCPRVVALGSGQTQVRIAPRGVAGRLAIRVQDFLKAGGYDENYDTWRGEDVDLVARLRRMGYAARFIDPRFLNAIRHGSGVRFHDYPYAAQYENDAEIKRINEAKHTVVNFGQIGVGTVYRNFVPEPIEIPPIPTRIFGVGLQRTATTSLHEAFKILGFSSFHWNTGDKARYIWDEMQANGKSWTLERYYALSDNPIPLLYKDLDLAYPGSKFILTLRDEVSWLKSVERLWDPRFNPNRWEWDTYPFSNRIHRELYGRADFDAEVFLTRYRAHNAAVMHYFRRRPKDFLVLRMDRNPGWEELCAFLGQDIPPVPYPFANVTNGGDAPTIPHGDPPMRSTTPTPVISLDAMTRKIAELTAGWEREREELQANIGDLQRRLESMEKTLKETQARVLLIQVPVPATPPRLPWYKRLLGPRP